MFNSDSVWARFARLSGRYLARSEARNGTVDFAVHGFLRQQAHRYILVLR